MRYRVFLPFGEYTNVSQPVSGQTDNRAEVSTVRAAHKNDGLYIDSKWCVDILDNMAQYKRQKWHTKGRRPIRQHGVWEDIYAMITTRVGSFQVTHMYRHNKVPHNEEADK